MTSTAEYVSAVAGTASPVLMTKGNSLPMSNFLTAANPSAANSNLGSNYVINSGTGVLYYAPSQTLLSTGAVNSNLADTTTQAASGAGAWAGGALAVSPVTGQSYSGYSIVLPTSDSTTPVFSAGNLIVTNAAVTAAAVSVQSLTLQMLQVQGASGAPSYFSVNSLSATMSVPMMISGITSPVIVYGTASTSTLQVLNVAGDNIFNVDTSNNIVTVGASTTGSTLVSYGTFVLEGGASTQKLLVTSGGSPNILLDTIDGSLTIQNVDMQLMGGLVISGTAAAEKLAVYNNDLTPALIFDVNTNTEQVTVQGDAVPDKFVVLDGAGTAAFSVLTGASQAFDQVGSVTIAALTSASTCGTAAAPWAAVYALNGTIQTSDVRQKNVLAQLEGARCLKAVRGLTPILHRWKDAARDQRARLGLTAQNVEAALEELALPEPSTAVVDEAGTMMVEMMQLLPVLAGAIQELDRKVSACLARFE